MQHFRDSAEQSVSKSAIDAADLHAHQSRVPHSPPPEAAFVVRALNDFKHKVVTAAIRLQQQLSYSSAEQPAHASPENGRLHASHFDKVLPTTKYEYPQQESTESEERHRKKRRTNTISEQPALQSLKRI